MRCHVRMSRPWRMNRKIKRPARAGHHTFVSMTRSAPRSVHKNDMCGAFSAPIPKSDGREVRRGVSLDDAAGLRRRETQRCQTVTQLVLGLDVGGSSVKAGAVDLAGGRLVGELISAPTPMTSDPMHLTEVLKQLARRLPQAKGGVGVAFPSVVKNGRIRTAANINSAWIGTDGARLVTEALGRPTTFLNDADAAGVAEMRWGAGQGVQGPVVMLTLGTGIGTALFIEGRLFPNTELGHLELPGGDAEKWASAHVRTTLKLDWPAWSARLNDYLERLDSFLWPDLIILGGAVSEHFPEFAPLLHVEAEIRAARFSGEAGVVGAAFAAAERNG